VRGGELQRVTHGELAAVVSPFTELTVTAPARAELLDYERAIRSQHALADVVPMRFGSVLSHEAAVRAHLDARQAAYLRALTRTAGCVEMGVRALLSPPPPPSAPEETAPPRFRSGAAYLKARQRRYGAESHLRERCAALEQLLLSKVAPLCREHRVELSRPGEPTLYSLYFLVPREQVAAFQAALSPMPTPEGARLALSGPWPTFNFVDEKTDAVLSL
jgi:hypothetical protein